MFQRFLALFHDAARHLRRAPGFASLAVALLALGLGGAVAVFSVVHAVVLRPLPFAEPERLVGVQAVNAPKSLVADGVSATDYRDLAARTRTLARTGAFRPNFAALTRPGEEAQRLVTALVTPGLLDTLGVAPALGRGFQPDDFRAAAPRTVILSHRLWQRLYSGSPDALNQTLILDDEPHTVIAVMPEWFREPSFVDAWLPFPNEAGEYFARDSRFWTMIGRLAPTASAATAQAELAGLAADLAREYPDTNRDWSVAVAPLHELRTRQLRPALWLLFGAITLVLLIACLNLANLLLARGIGRLPEFGVRLALGATPRQLAAGALVEGALLAATGGLLGTGLAAIALPLLEPHLPDGLVPAAGRLTLHGPILLVALALSGASGLLCSALPAAFLWRIDVHGLLQDGAAAGQTGHRATRWQSLLVGGQVALTVAVAGVALLLLQSLSRLQRQPPGLDPDGVIALRLSPPPLRYETQADLARYYDTLLEAVAAVPGVHCAAVNASAPFSGITLTYPTWPDGALVDAASAISAVYAPVSERYLETLRIPLRAGRGFTAHDREDGAPVAIVNEAYARRAFPDGRALGRRVLLLPWLGQTYREIVGVVADTRQDSLVAPPPPQVYVPQRQMPWFFSTLLVRLEQPGVTAAVQAALRRADPTLPFAPTAVADDIAQTTTQPRLYAVLFTGFGLLALGLSAFGIYASVRFTMGRRGREIGVRLALGAGRTRIVGWVLAQIARPVAAGTGLGLTAAVALALLARAHLYGVSLTDASVAVLLPALLGVVAGVATLPTAWRSARLDPAHALRAP